VLHRYQGPNHTLLATATATGNQNPMHNPPKTTPHPALNATNTPTHSVHQCAVIPQGSSPEAPIAEPPPSKPWFVLLLLILSCVRATPDCTARAFQEPNLDHPRHTKREPFSDKERTGKVQNAGNTPATDRVLHHVHQRAGLPQPHKTAELAT
jgi:hypothetical protein